MCVCIHQTLALSLYPNGFLGADALREGFTAQGRQFWTGRPIIKGGKKWREKMCGSIRVLASGGEDSNHFRAKSALKLVFPPHHSYSTNIKRDLLVCFRKFPYHSLCSQQFIMEKIQDCPQTRCSQRCMDNSILKKINDYQRHIKSTSVIQKQLRLDELQRYT